MLHNRDKTTASAEEILLEKWKLPEIIGIKEAEEPSICYFNNSLNALKLLEKHINNNSKTAIHFDVDFDGIASGFLIYKELVRRKMNKISLAINKEKEHGIKDKHADYMNNNGFEMLIVVDSSTNEIDTIRKCKCDVLVIDHHESSIESTFGYCEDAEHVYIIVNSTLEAYDFESNNYSINEIEKVTSKYIDKCMGTQDMSCGLVVYETLRLWYAVYNNIYQLDSSSKYQWAAASLLTDQINMINRRNQWYIQKMNRDKTVDETLLQIKDAINRYSNHMDKSYIQFKLAPIINKAIRADAGNEVLNIIVHNPRNITELDIYSNRQKEVMDEIDKLNKEDGSSYIIADITDTDISKSYNGVIASRLCGDNKKNTVCIKRIGDEYRGSFRARGKGFDYRQQFLNNGIEAEGHPYAFGFRSDSTNKIRLALLECEKDIPYTMHVNHFLSLGNVDNDMLGTYHIESAEEFRKSKMLMMLAYGNSNVGSVDEIQIVASTKDIVLKEAKEKFFKYTLLGDIELISFETLHGNHIYVYAEYGNDIRLYGRNM